MSKYKRHRNKWKGCKRCELHKSRNKIVLARGAIPCDVLFIGEAPGHSEDTIGVPFIGPAGKLLDKIIEQSLDGQFNYAITNLVACIPKSEDGIKLEEPTEQQIKACISRLEEFIRLAKPRVTVLVGKLAGNWVPKLFGYGLLGKTTVEIIHPAAILRMDVSQRGLAIQRAVVTVSDAAFDD